MSERNQAIKQDKGKVRLELIPPEAYLALGEVLTYGLIDHEINSWKQVEPDRFVGALLRHFIAYIKDPTSRNEESGILHIDHCLCNAMFLSSIVRNSIDKDKK